MLVGQHQSAVGARTRAPAPLLHPVTARSQHIPPAHPPTRRERSSAASCSASSARKAGWWWERSRRRRTRSRRARSCQEGGRKSSAPARRAGCGPSLAACCCLLRASQPRTSPPCCPAPPRTHLCQGVAAAAHGGARAPLDADGRPLGLADDAQRLAAPLGAFAQRGGGATCIADGRRAPSCSPLLQFKHACATSSRQPRCCYTTSPLLGNVQHLAPGLQSPAPPAQRRSSPAR